MADFILRAITRSGAFRLVVAQATESVREAVLRQKMVQPVADAFGKLMVGAAMIRSTLHTYERFQISIKHNGAAGDLFVDTWPDGMVRGYVQDPTADPNVSGRPVVGAIGVVEVSRSRMQRDHHIYQSITEVVSGNIVDELEMYMAESEQLPTSLRAQIVFDESGFVLWAGGVLVQVLPEADHADLKELVKRMDECTTLYTPETTTVRDGLFRLILHNDIPFDVVAEETLVFRCNCDELRVLSSFATLQRDELLELVNEGNSLDVTCGYCNRHYVVSPDVIRALLEPN
ncbi:MAG: Hsp33 family molecular chaperone HslO [Myxococcales bacterium]|nr:Hsp33 family molecular chaperone HslO [Myxococcales bacterium]